MKAGYGSKGLGLTQILLVAMSVARRGIFIAGWTWLFFFGSFTLLLFAKLLFFSRKEVSVIGAASDIVAWIMALVGLVLGLFGKLPGTRSQYLTDLLMAKKRVVFTLAMVRRVILILVWTWVFLMIGAVLGGFLCGYFRINEMYAPVFVMPTVALGILLSLFEKLPGTRSPS